MSDKPWYMPSSPGELAPHPWLHPDAIDYLEQLLQPDWMVLEHGAGGSTLWMAERVASLVTLEHNPVWRERVRELAPANVTVLTSEIGPPASIQGSVDLFFIDGERDERGLCLERAPDFVRPGGWVVLDNANRPEYAKEREELRKHAKLVARFDNNIPRSLYFVTEFWQCASE